MPRKILLADDSVTAQNMGRKILVDAGYEVVTVNNGSAALKRVNESKPDLVVLDVYMPGYSGLEVCQRLKETAETAHIPVLLTVGKLEPFKPDEARRARADAHIVKPFEASELLSALGRLEDRMVPLAEGKTRKKAGDNNSARADASETGWTTRLRFATQKKKEEAAAAELSGAATSFHDFRRSKGKVASQPPAAAESVPEREPEVVPDIPRDITPDELDVLSAVAACLDSHAPPPTQTATSAAANTAPLTEFAINETAASEESIAPAAEVKIEAEAAPVSSLRGEVVQSPDTATVKTGTFSQEPAPVDREDEPIFAVTPVVEEEAVANPVETATNLDPVGGAHQSDAKAESSVEQSGTEAAGVAVPSPETTIEKTAAEVVAEQVSLTTEPASPAPVAAVAQEVVEAEGPGPSDEELAAALRLLTPAGHAEPAALLSELQATANNLAEQTHHDQASGPRWIAEPVPLSQEEASISLEAEMFGTVFAASACEGSSAVSQGSTTEPAGEVPSAVETHLGSDISAETAAASAEESIADSTIAAAAVAAIFETPAPDTPQADRQASPESEAKTTEPRTEESISDQTPAASLETAAEQVAEAACTGHDMATQGAMVQGVIAQAIAQAHPEALTIPAESSPDAPKAMAAAAAADSASPVLTDPNAIASIVESVLADLRPKIVEEITRKLSGK